MSEGIWALIGVAIGALLTGLFSYVMQVRQFQHNKDMYLLQNKSKEAVKEILEEMLNHRIYAERSFMALKKPIGGFSDEELRQILHELDAKKTIRDDGSEWWYLISRQQDRFRKGA